MLAISGYAEWFWLIAMGWKDVENRKWPLDRYISKADLPACVWLHGSKTKASEADIAFIKARLTWEQNKRFELVDWSRYRGYLMGQTTISECTKYGDMLDVRTSKWFFGPYGFWLDNSQLFEKPLPFRGQLGIFPVLPKDFPMLPAAREGT